MLHSQNDKVVSTGIATVATDATSATVVDTLGFNYATIDVIHRPATSSSSSAKWITLQLTHGTTTHPTNHTAISGTEGTSGTASSSQFVLGVHNDTSVDSVVRFFVNLPKYERYIRVVKTAPASHSLTVNTFNLSRAEQSPDTVALRGVINHVFV